MSPNPKRIDTVSELMEFIYSALPGDAVIYHHGSLLDDRIADEDLNALATRIMTFSQNGIVCLTQKRHGDLEYDYVAVRRQ